MPRPKKLTNRKKEQFLFLLAAGNTIVSICEALEIDPSTYRKERGVDKDFADNVDDVKTYRCTLVEDALYGTAMAGNVTAQIFFLCNRAPDKWQNVNKVQAKVEADINANHRVTGVVVTAQADLSNLNMDELEAYIANLEILLSQAGDDDQQ